MGEFVEYHEGEAFPGVIGRTLDESSPAWPVPVRPPDGAPNVVLFVLDDVGYGQPSPFGGLCEMPTLDALAQRGLRYANFQTTALCSPTRGCLLTGRNHHTLGLASITELSLGFPAHDAYMGFEHGFLSEILLAQGYNTFAVGKWHLTPPQETSSAGPFHRWPLGRGFERYHGFLGGDTDQWFPVLVRDNGPVEPAYGPEDGYHLNRDLADTAIQFVKDAHVASPDKPFFLYYAAGAGHSPHHVEPEWIERYRGRFDMGWDVYREEVLRRQIEAGIVAEGTSLPERDPDVPAWDTLSADEKRMYAHQMEVYAAFLSQTDHHFGRFLAFLDHIGELDNTLVIAVSDNGASPEGGIHGTFNELLFFNFAPERLEDNLARYDGWGGVDTFPHYSWGWTSAGNTPFRRWKRETYRGGVSDLCIVSWPSRISAGGDVRSQYAHAIDVLPTVLDAAGIEAPEAIRGVAQSAVHGVSLAHTFADAAAPTRHTTQYFEMLGHRSLYHEGWKAVCPWVGPSFAEAAERGRVFGLSELTAPLLEEIDANGWELYDLSRDPGETRNLAAEEPQRLAEMIQRWYVEAGRYGVLPLAAVGPSRAQRPLLSGERTGLVFYPGAAPLPFSAAPRLVNRPYSITAEVSLADVGAASGVLLSQGNRHGGFAFYMQDGFLCHVYNYLGLERFTVSSPERVPPGQHVLRHEFEPTGHANLLLGRGVPARSKLYVDGEIVAVVDLPYSIPIVLGVTGVSCGYDTADAVDPTSWSAPFAFNSDLHRVTLDLSGEVTVDLEAEVARIMAQQ